MPVVQPGAAPVSLDTARTVAERWYWEASGTRPTHVSPIEGAVKGADEAFYAFKSDRGGIVIVARDDIAFPVFFYALSADINYEEPPPQLLALMQAASSALATARVKGVPPTAEIQRVWKRLTASESTFTPDKAWKNQNLPPLLTTRWNQWNYYNAWCPEDENGPGGHVLAGCIAIAMAQIMRFHDHPPQGTGTQEYTHDAYGTLSVNFEEAVYSWAQMPDTLTDYHDHVAQVIFHCGVAVLMNYGPNNSSAPSNRVVAALRNHFRYDTSPFTHRDSYTDSEWASRIRANLDARMPVYYRGTNAENEGGHAFVLDGYQGQSHFHVNWGWVSNWDGYFHLDEFTPSNRTYTHYHRAIFDITPSKCSRPEVLSHPTLIHSPNVSVSWSASTTDNVVYVLEEARDAAFSTDVRIAYRGEDTTVTISDRGHDETYYYRVKATRDAYLDSEWRTSGSGCHVQDVTPPAILLIGSQTVSLECGMPYEEAGATAWDDFNGDMTQALITTHDIENHAPGIYHVLYEAGDYAGNVAQASRTVVVVDTIAPEITLYGEPGPPIECGDTYTLEDAAAWDRCQGDISSQITVDNPVDSTMPGTYEVTWNVADDEGNSAQATRLISVVDSAPPVLTLGEMMHAQIDTEGFIVHECGDVLVEPEDFGAWDVCSGKLELTSEPLAANDPGIYAFAWRLDEAGEPAWFNENPIIHSYNTFYKSPGDYLLIYIAQDSAGNTYPPLDESGMPPLFDEDGKAAFYQIDFARQLRVIDTQPPILELGLHADMPHAEDGFLLLECNSPYAEPPDFWARDRCCGDLGLPVRTFTGERGVHAAAWALGASGEIILRNGAPEIYGYDQFTKQPGDYALVYTLTDASGYTYPALNEQGLPTIMDHDGRPILEAARLVRVRDSQAPRITLAGDTEITLECGSLFTEPGSSAWDDCAGNVSNRITVDDTTLDTSAPGVYRLTYDVTDDAGNAADTKFRTVTVIDTQPPGIHLLGEERIQLEYGADFSDPGAIAWDSCDGDLTQAIRISGDAVDTHASGTYTITYAVEDAVGNRSSTERRVLVAPRATVTVPTVLLLTLEEATAILQTAQLQVGTVTEQYHASTPSGQVIHQSPSPGSGVLAGTEIALTVSIGPLPEDPAFEGEGVTEGEGEDVDNNAGCSACSGGKSLSGWLGDWLLVGLAFMVILVSHNRAKDGQASF